MAAHTVVPDERDMENLKLNPSRILPLILLGIFLPISLIFAQVCQAATVTGTQLLTWCQTDPSRADLYIDAFDDTARVARTQADESAKRLPRNASIYDELFHRFIGRFCIPRDQKVETTTIVCRWLSVHHDLLGMPAPRLIAQSYQGAFPCLDE